MTHRILGIAEKSGDYEGRAYCNYLLHTTYHNDKVEGSAVSQVKVKKDTFIANLQKLGLQNRSQLIGKEVKFYYNQFGQVDVIELVK